MARRLRTQVRQGPRRQLKWLDLQVPNQAVIANQQVLLLSLTAAELEIRPFTIVRTRFYLAWESDQTAAVEFFGGVVALVHTTQKAVAIGITAIDTPIAEPNSSNFLVYEPFFGQSVVLGTGAPGPMGRMIDSKGMRKIGPDDDVGLVVAALNLNGFNVSVVGRVLIKLH